jgi:hypothetical protein
MYKNIKNSIYVVTSIGIALFIIALISMNSERIILKSKEEEVTLSNFKLIELETITCHRHGCDTEIVPEKYWTAESTPTFTILVDINSQKPLKRKLYSINSMTILFKDKQIKLAIDGHNYSNSLSPLATIFKTKFINISHFNLLKYAKFKTTNNRSKMCITELQFTDQIITFSDIMTEFECIELSSK